MLQSSHSDGAQSCSIIPVPHSPPLPHGACATHSPCAPCTPADHVTTAASCLYPSGSNSKTGGKIKNQPSRLTAFHIVPQGLFWGIPASPAGVSDLNHSRWPSLPKCWCGAGPFCFPTLSHSEPCASLHPWLLAGRLDAPLFLGAADSEEFRLQEDRRRILLGDIGEARRREYFRQ